MNEIHETEAKLREAKSGKRRAQLMDSERLRKAIQYLGEQPAIPARAPQRPIGVLSAHSFPIARRAAGTGETTAATRSVIPARSL
jgi:hypothetical protein